jgi:hypothetical protein
MSAAKLPKVETVRDNKGRVVFHFDPAKVPSRSASLSTRLQFAAAYIQAFIDGRFATASTLRLVAKWVQEGADRLAPVSGEAKPRKTRKASK